MVALFRAATSIFLLGCALARGEEGRVLIGNVVDVDRMETVTQDFEGGWGEWSHQAVELLDTSNMSDPRLSVVAVPTKVGPTVLVPQLAPAETASVLSYTTAIKADSEF